MDALRGILLKLRALLRPRAVERELDDELRFHIDMEADKNVGEGMAPDDARRAARVAFGGVERHREAARDVRGVSWWEEGRRDLRHAARQLRRSPAFTAVVVLTLALGIGANTAIFSVVDGVLLRPAPLPEAEDLVVVWETDRDSETMHEPGAWPDFVDFRRDARALENMAAIRSAEINFTPETGEAARLTGVEVTHDYLETLGIRPLLGRGFTEQEDQPGGGNVVLLGESFWRGHFGADPGAVGRTMRLNDASATIIGVLPQAAEFGLDQVHARADYHAAYNAAGDVHVWLPLQTSEQITPRSTHPFLMLGRLAPGTSLPVAQQELSTIAARLEETFPVNQARGVNLEPLTAVVFGPVRPALYILLGAVGLVLLVACVNVANLLLARGAARAREVAVRSALGARLPRLGRQFLVESLLLSLLGGAAAVVVAYVGLDLLTALAPADIPRLSAVSVDARVLAATLVVCLAVGVVFGLVPTLQARRLDVQGTLRGEGRGVSATRRARALRRGLVVTELALAVMLVVGAGLLVRSFWSVLSVDPGFRAEGVLKAQYQLPANRYPRDFAVWPRWAEIHAFNDALLGRVSGLPGVEAAAIAGAHPLDEGFANSFVVVGREAEAADWPEIATRQVTPSYFEVVGVPVVRGRGFAEGDVSDAPPVAVVNGAAAERFFADQDPIGQEVRFWGISRRIVGVVGNERFHGITEAPPPAVYTTLAQTPMGQGVLLVRTSGDPLTVARPVRAAVAEQDPGLAVFGVEPLSETLLGTVAERRFLMMLLGVFAGVALVLALVGVHGVLSYTVAQRAPELGIRLALGASRGSVVGLVLRGGAALAVTGIVLGLAGALATSRVLSGLLYGVTTTDPATFVLVPAAILAAAVLASWLPARRITGIDPMTALRAE